MDAHPILDHGETAEINSVYGTTAETKSTQKNITFYFVEHHRYEFIEIVREIEKTNLEIKKKNEVIDDYYKDLKRYREEEKKAEWELGNWIRTCEHLTSSIQKNREYLFYVQNALNKKSTDNRVVMQSPEVTEFTKHISGLKHRVQRGRLTMKEETQLLKQMKELKGEKNKVVTLVSNNQKRR